jgi:transposase-like protein
MLVGSLGFWCIYGKPMIGTFKGFPNASSCFPRPHLLPAPLRPGSHRAVRAVVSDLPAELSRPRRHDGRTQCRCDPYEHHALVHRFVPEFERRWARFAKPSSSSWRMDETNVSVRGRWHYLYRTVDRNGKSVHSLLCEDRTIDSAQAFFRQAVAGSEWPQKINLDGNAATHRALRLLAQEDARWRSVEIRSRRYLNNVVEQDHRAIKRRCASMLGMKSFRTAAVTLSGIELAHRIRKRQFTLPHEREGRTRSLKELWEQALSQNHVSESLESTDRPLTHQISIRSPSVRIRGRRARGALVRYARKIAFGHSLYLLVMPR